MNRVAKPPGPATKKEIFGWAMFDFANSSYTTVVITVVYSPFFTSTIVPSSSPIRNSYWSIAIILGTLLALVLSPFVGAVCDYSGRKKRYLIGSAVICSIATAALSLVGVGSIWAGICLIGLSYSAFMVGECFCASFLTELATSENMGRISGIGWALGYLGGLASLAIVYMVITADGALEPGLYFAQHQLAMVVIGAFFLVAALPTFLLLESRGLPAPGFERASIRKLLRAGWAEFTATWRLALRYPILFRFLVAFMVYMAGLYVVINFVAIYAKEELRLEDSDIYSVFLIVQLSAAAGALGFGYIDSILGTKKTVLVTLGWWIVAVVAIFFIEPIATTLALEQKIVFFGIAMIAGSAIGSTQSSSRAVVGLLAPAGRSAQMFGFWGTFARMAQLLAMAYGFLSDAIGSMRWALILVVCFFVAGGLLLARIPIEQGIEEAGAETGR